MAIDQWLTLRKVEAFNHKPNTMSTVQIKKEKLKDYLDQFSRNMPAELVEIEVAGLDLGHQIETAWVPMSSISYDPKDDVIVIGLDDGKLEHMIRQPVDFWVNEAEAGVTNMSVKCAEGLKHLIRLKEPRRLAASGG